MSADVARTTTPDNGPIAGSASLADLAPADGGRFLLATFTTPTGTPCSRLMPVETADEL